MLGALMHSMRAKKFFIGFVITAGVIVLLSTTSRMMLQGSLLDEQQASVSIPEVKTTTATEVLGDPLSLEALLDVQYRIADSSVRSALSRTGRGFSITFDDNGVLRPSRGNTFAGPGIDGASLQQSRIAVGDVDGDRRTDSVIPLIVRVGENVFTELAIVRNRGDDNGEYVGGYPLGNRVVEVDSIEIRGDRTMLVKFQYLAPGESDAVDAQILVTVKQAE